MSMEMRKLNKNTSLSSRILKQTQCPLGKIWRLWSKTCGRNFMAWKQPFKTELQIWRKWLPAKQRKLLILQLYLQRLTSFSCRRRLKKQQPLRNTNSCRTTICLCSRKFTDTTSHLTGSLQSNTWTPSELWFSTSAFSRCCFAAAWAGVWSCQ